jgi:hypothetical protein
MSSRLTTVFCGLMLCLGGTAIAAEPLDWNEPVSKFAEFVAELSAGRQEEAWQIYKVMLPNPPKQPQTPFEPDPFEAFQQSVGRFPANVEAIQHVATRVYSERSRRMYFMADTDFGPYLVEMMFYRAREQWFFAHFSYHSVAMADLNWHKQYENVLPITKLAEPVPIKLPKRAPAAETAAQ